MICANPDREVIRGGVRQICAGAIAERYESLGGEVRWYGKPDPTIYDECFRLLILQTGHEFLGSAIFHDRHQGCECGRARRIAGRPRYPRRRSP